MESERIELVNPSVDFKSEFLSMLEEFLAEDDKRYRRQFESACKDFSAYVLKLVKHSGGIELAAGPVLQTTFWLVRDGRRILGQSELRQRLTPALEVEGGHIGYSIRPSERRKGYGTRILALTLEKARRTGLERVLVTCDTDNIASAKIIKKNGGKFAGESISPQSGKPVSRYWIELLKKPENQI